MKTFETYEKMLDNKQYHALRGELIDENPADIAGLIENIPVDKAVLIFRMLPKDMEAEVFADLFPDVQKELIGKLSETEIQLIMEELFLDDAVDFIEEMPATVAKKILANAKPETREEINRLLKYPEDSAGSIMTVEYVDLKSEMTVREAFERIRKTGTDKETIYTCYVTDSERKLKGIVSAKTLMLAERDEIIGEIMEEANLIIAETLEDREEIAHRFNKYDLLSIPVVDSEKRLVGIITVDDIADVIQEEATEDFQKMAAILPSDKPYLKTTPIILARNRIVWLLVLMIAAMITGSILDYYETAIAVVPLLVTFIPMLMDTGGNSGSQSATMVIRGMALAEITPRDFFKVVWKEMRTGFLVGCGLSAVNFIRVWFFYRNRVEFGGEILMISAVVSFTLLFTVMAANLIGGILPIIAKKCKIDPAVMAAPLITTIVDAGSLLVFFALSTALLM
ncbi:MAG: magnesium transporter [Oscillospiraceae bacterium]|nr:magnesium transporter [Oscillospiraceae bacterium]